MEIQDESKPEFRKAKLFNKPSKMKIRDEVSDSESESDDTVSLNSNENRGPKVDYSKFANPSKIKVHNNHNSDDDSNSDDDLSSDDSDSGSDSDSDYDSDDDDSDHSVRKSYKDIHRLAPDPQEGIKKRKILIELKVMERDHGIELSHGISEKSNLDELELEKKMHKQYIGNESTKEFYRMGIVQFANMIELVTMAYNPMNVKLKGWSSNLNENIHSFDEVLGELAEKYGSGTTPPEIRLIFALCSSAFMYNMNQKAVEMMGGGALNNINQAMANTTGARSSGTGMQMPDLGSLFGGGSGGFNPLDLLKAFKPSAPPSANGQSTQQRVNTQQQQQQQQTRQQLNPQQIASQSIPNQGTNSLLNNPNNFHSVPTKPVGPLINPPKPMNTDGFNNRPQSTLPDYVAQNTQQSSNRFAQPAPNSPGRFSLASSDSGESIEINFKPQQKRKKTSSKKVKRSFKLN